MPPTKGPSDVTEMEMMFKACARCRGDLYCEEDLGQAELVCLQCGFRLHVAPVAAGIGISLAAVEVMLGFRLGFLLAGANPSNGFVDFIYDISDPLAEPFQGIVSNRGVDGGTFEPASIIAMLVYLVAGALLIALILATRSGLVPHGDRVVSSRTRRREGVGHED